MVLLTNKLSFPSKTRAEQACREPGTKRTRTDRLRPLWVATSPNGRRPGARRERGAELATAAWVLAEGQAERPGCPQAWTTLWAEGHVQQSSSEAAQARLEPRPRPQRLCRAGLVTWAPRVTASGENPALWKQQVFQWRDQRIMGREH